MNNINYSKNYTNFFYTIAQFFKNLFIKKEEPLPRDKIGNSILVENFHGEGEKPQPIKPSWLHEHFLPRTLLRSIKFAERDRRLLLKRERAIEKQAEEHFHQTLDDLRKLFGSSYRKNFPHFFVRRMTITTVDDVSLDTYVIINPRSENQLAYEQKWIIFFHPADVAYEETLFTLAKISQDTGANIYTGNYRGVGSSQGRPTRSLDLVVDGVTMVEHLLKSGVLPRNILIHGFSIGGGVGTEVASKYPGVHLCNDRSFTRYSDAFIEYIPPGFKSFSMRRFQTINWEFDTLHHLEKITGHVLVIGSLLDGTIRGRASLARAVSPQEGPSKRKVIWLTEEYLEEPDFMRPTRAHSDHITMTSKYGEYLDFVKDALNIHDEGISFRAA